jgi:hypothetical protein
MIVASTTSDVEDIFPLTPHSKHSAGACRIVDASGGATSPTSSLFLENQHGDAFRHDGISSFEDQHMFRLVDSVVYDKSTSEDVEQKVGPHLIRMLSLS